ncbi:DUF6894 family protein [Belnapia arida]|uniref:DUF6894 family protein n=1 Tax=Belnapia arida TaxID=2804533 RepID=UPI0038B27835
MARTNRRILSSVTDHGRDGRRLSLVPVPVGETFYLDIYGCGLSSCDNQGERLPDIAAARLQALLTATNLLRVCLHPQGLGQSVTVVVRDEGGERYRVTIFAG